MTRKRGAGPWWHYLGVAVVCVLGGCGLLADEPASVVAQSEPEVVMSGGYVVGEDGKLLKRSDRIPALHPEYPDEGRVLDEEGAGEFALYYFRLLAYAWDSGDISELSALSRDECTFCQSIEPTIARIYSEGGWVEGLRYFVLDREPAVIVGPPTLPQDTYVVVMKVQTTERTEYRNGVLEHPDSEIHKLELRLVPGENGWEVEELAGIRDS